MTLVVRKAPLFEHDFLEQFTWYLEEANEEIAWRFKHAVDTKLVALSQNPRAGHERHFKHPLLRELRSIRLEHPFEGILIFYRIGDGVIDAWRLMHGRRDLAQRLVE